MEITAAMVKELRSKTGAGIIDCKKALSKAEGDITKSIELLRKKGLSDASKKQDRNTSEGLISSYLHHSGKVGVMLEINCETDFVARTDKFQDLVKDIAMHIAAADPTYLKIEDVPADAIEKEKEIFRDQMKESGKPENIIDKIVEGKIKKYYTDVCLVEQTYVKDNDKTIKDVIANAISELGENISISRFVRYQLGAK